MRHDTATRPMAGQAPAAASKSAAPAQGRAAAAQSAELLGGSASGHQAAVAQSMELGALPYRAQMESAFGEDFSGVSVARGASMGAHPANAIATPEAVRFKATQPAPEQVAHELAHVVQFRRFGTPAAEATDAGAPSEVEARAVGRQVAAGGRAGVSERPAARIAYDSTPSAEQTPEQIATQIAGALQDRSTAGPVVLRLLRSAAHSPLRVRAIREAFEAAQRWPLERAAGDLQHGTHIIAILRLGMSLGERLTHAQTVDKPGIAGLRRIIESSPMVERRRLFVERRMDWEAIIARVAKPERLGLSLMVAPEGARLHLVKRHALETSGWRGGDAAALREGILALSPRARARFRQWADHEPKLKANRAQIRALCGVDAPLTERQTLDVALDQAIESGDDAQLNVVLQRTASIADEARQLRRSAKKGEDEPQSQAHDARREALGDIEPAEQGQTQPEPALLTVVRTQDGRIDPSCFVGKLYAKLDFDRWVDVCAGLGVDPFEICKERLLRDRARFWKGRAHFNAVIANLMVTPSGAVLAGGRRDALRDRLLNDEHLKPLVAELAEGSGGALLEGGDSFAVQVHRLEAYVGRISVDEIALLTAVMQMSITDRQRLAEHPLYTQRVMRHPLVSARTKALMRALVSRGNATGALPTEAALDMALQRVDPDEALVMLALQSAHPAYRARIRRGYRLHRTHATPKSPAERDALWAFETLQTDLKRLDAKHADRALSILLGTPDPSAAASPDGRQETAEIMLLRQQEHIERSGTPLNLLSQTDEALHSAHVEFLGQYERISADGGVGMRELATLAALDGRFWSAAQAHRASVVGMADVASSLSAVAVGVLVVAASASAGPAAVLLISTLGGAITKAVAADVFAGEYQSLISEDGARNAFVGGLEGALSVLFSGLAARATSAMGLSGAALRTQLIKATAQASGAGAKAMGRSISASVVEGIIEGTLAGAVGEMAFTALQADLWNQSVWRTLSQMGDAVLRGGLLGGIAGGGMGGLFGSGSALLTLRKVERLKIQRRPELGRRSEIVLQAADGRIDGMRIAVGPEVSTADVDALLQTVDDLDELAKIQRRLSKKESVSDVRYEGLKDWTTQRADAPLTPRDRYAIREKLEAARALEADLKTPPVAPETPDRVDVEPETVAEPSKDPTPESDGVTKAPAQDSNVQSNAPSMTDPTNIQPTITKIDAMIAERQQWLGQNLSADWVARLIREIDALTRFKGTLQQSGGILPQQPIYERSVLWHMQKDRRPVAKTIPFSPSNGAHSAGVYKGREFLWQLDPQAMATINRLLRTRSSAHQERLILRTELKILQSFVKSPQADLTLVQRFQRLDAEFRSAKPRKYPRISNQKDYQDALDFMEALRGLLLKQRPEKRARRKARQARFDPLAHQKIKQDNTSLISPEQTWKNVHQVKNAIWDNAAEYNQLVNSITFGKDGQYTYDGSRAWYDSAAFQYVAPNGPMPKQTINIGDGLTKGTHFHELGHSMEAKMPDHFWLGANFLRSRMGDQPIPMRIRDVYQGSYDVDEVGWVADVINPYVGKEYPKTWTSEIFSMGIEQFASAEQMLWLYKMDPEYFMFIVGMMIAPK